jgi:DNA primase
MALQQEKILSVLNRLLKQSPRMRKGGTEAIYFCPSCKHYKRKLEVSLITGKYHCWVCGFAGKNFGTLLKKLNAPRDCYEIVGEVKKLKAKEAFDDFFNPEGEKEKIKSLPAEFTPLSECKKTIECSHALHYLAKRGITDIDIIRYNIGYCADGDFKNRIVIPSYDADGELNFYSCRDYYDTSWLKYVNCDFSKNIVGFELLVDFSDEVTLVEGAFDAIAVRTNCIPLFGKTMSERLKIKLLENKPKCVNILLDNDALEDSIKNCEYLMKNGLSVKLVELKEKDPSVLGFVNTWDYIDNTPLLTFNDLFRLKMNL